MRNGFVYLWHDKVRNIFYLGSHLGSLSDGYVGSNDRLQKAYNKRPETFKRRVLEFHESIDSKSLRNREQLWLNLIKPEELHGIRYYNEKKFAAGGDIVSSLPVERRKLHKERSVLARLEGLKKDVKQNPEKWKAIAKNARASWTEESYQKCKEAQSKSAILQKDGEIFQVSFLKEFCKEKGLNYSSMKQVCYGKRNSCYGWKGNYTE